MSSRVEMERYTNNIASLNHLFLLLPAESHVCNLGHFGTYLRDICEMSNFWRT